MTAVSTIRCTLHKAARLLCRLPLTYLLSVSLFTTLYTTSGALQAQTQSKAPAPNPKAAVVDPADKTVNHLKVGTLVQFEAGVRNVGEAAEQLLSPVRYKLTNRTVDGDVMNSVLRRPVPPAARNGDLMTIEAALLLLIGEDNRLVVDHRNRLVAIERPLPQMLPR